MKKRRLRGENNINVYKLQNDGIWGRIIKGKEGFIKII